MKKMMRVCLALALVLATLALAGCGSKQETATKAPAAEKDINDMSVDELVAAAAAEGNFFETVGMPDDWAAWGISWQALKDTYGIEHRDVDMTSAEELSTFEAEKDDPTRDLGDVGMSFTKTAIDMDVVRGFKPSTWDSIPDWAKDPDGRWIISYTGTMTFCALSDKVGGKIPSTWKELMDSSYRVSVGNVPSGSASQVAVIAAAYAMGGDMDNLQPGIDYFVELAKQGRLDPGDTTYARMANGEIEVNVGMYTYSSLNWRDMLKKDTDLDMLVTIPQDGAITSGYALVFNKYAAHPYTTALAIEYLLSDKGQADRAYGYASPIRDVELPSDVATLDKDLYKNAITVNDIAKLDEACKTVANMWTEQVTPLMG